MFVFGNLQIYCFTTIISFILDCFLRKRNKEQEQEICLVIYCVVIEEMYQQNILTLNFPIVLFWYFKINFL